MSADIVRIDYEGLESTAAKYRHHAAEVREMERLLLRALGDLRDGGWEGRGADAFYSEMEEVVLPAVQRLIAALEDADLTTRQIARTFQSAEEEAAAPFR